MVNRNAEEAVHLRRVQRHGQNAVRPRGGDQVGDEPAAERDAWSVLLVRSGVRIVRHDGGDTRRRSTTSRVDHQQELDQVLLHGWHERLDQEDVTLSAVGAQSHL